MDRVIFVTAIDTGAGKSYVTGLLARYLSGTGRSVITQKLAQTGCTGLSRDIRKHRELMGIELLPEDTDGLTCPFVFDFPSSPHLAARLAGKEIDCALIDRATRTLVERYDHVILEGVGGLCVPLTDSVTVVDYVAACGYPVILVSSARLGSINHTLMSLEVLGKHCIQVLGVAYNRFFDEQAEIASDSRRIIERRLKDLDHRPAVVDIPDVSPGMVPEIDFPALLG